MQEASYAGSKKKQIREGYEQRFGEENWSKGHYYDEKILSRDETYSVYEDGYFHFLNDNQDILEWLVTTACEVYDIAPSNVDSGLDYSVQECKATHLQDISVRRVMKRLGKEFQGDHLVQIRGHTSEGYILNPGKVPFHKPELILHSDRKSWWDKDSIEDFYQSNKALLVNPEVLSLRPVIRCPDGDTIYSYDKRTYYRISEEQPRLLWIIKGKKARRLLHEDKRYKRLRGEERKAYSCSL